jgi:hypothetical protein
MARPLLMDNVNYRTRLCADTRITIYPNKQQMGLKSLKTQAPSGGLVDIDQEVVTLRGPFGTIPGSGTTFAGAPILVR